MKYNNNATSILVIVAAGGLFSECAGLTLRKIVPVVFL